MKKTPGDITILHISTNWLDDVWFLRYGARWTDGRKKWHTEVGAPPQNTMNKSSNFHSEGWTLDFDTKVV